MARAVSGFSKIQKPLIESGAMKYKPRNRPGEGPADAGFVLRETRLYRRKENGVLQEYLGQDTRHDQDQRAADARCDLSKGQKLHALCRRQHGDVARAAHVRGAKTGGNGGFDGVEADEVAADKRGESRGTIKK